MTPKIPPFGQQTDQATIARAIEPARRSAGLRCTMKDTLRAYPGCIHWHFKNDEEPGTLEATYWPGEDRGWFSVQAGRSADWIGEAQAAVHKSIRQRLSAGRKTSK